MRDGRRAFLPGLGGSGVLWLALLVVGCGDGVTGPKDAAEEVTVTEPVPALVSAGSSASFGELSVVSPLERSLQADVSYISFPPGAIPRGDSIEVRNLRTDAVNGGPVVDGGLDPVPIPAQVGDELQITTLAFGDPKPVKRFVRVVPEEEPPVVVRTDPRRRRTKVPLNKAVDIIFSEPIALASVDSETVSLLMGDEAVPVEISESLEGLLIRLTPLVPLKPATTYTIAVASDLQDLSGSVLSALFESEFTTTDEMGAIEVITETSRAGSLETDGYWILLDGVQGPHIGVQDTVVLNDVGAGLHHVSLAGLGPTCFQKSPGDVIVPASDTARIVLPVVCYPGQLQIDLVFSGGHNYPWDDVVWTWDDSVRWEVPFSTFVTGSPPLFSSGIWGERKLELILPKNCEAENNPRTVFLPEGELATLTFQVLCYSAYLEVTTATSGTSIDPDGYQLVIDGEEAFPFGANEQRTLHGVQPGDRVLELTGIDSRCTLSGDNPRTVTVHALEEGGSTMFELACTAGGAPGESIGEGRRTP